MPITNTDEVNKEIFKIWGQENFNVEEEVWIPLVYPATMKKNSLLFIGLNPSFSLKGFKTILKDTEFDNLDIQDFFRWNNNEVFDLGKAQKIEHYGRANYSYFNKFKEIARDINMEWEHIDLFFYRETSQNKLKDKIYEKNMLTDFAKKQIELSSILINIVEPKIIIVTNALASKLFEEEFKSEFDENLGYHLTKLNHGMTPTFLASMLTGQRAMDLYSYQRLCWHIKQAVKR